MKQPICAPSASILPGAVVVGNVELGADVNIWFNAVIRADLDCIKIGPRTNIQDGVILHTDEGFPMSIGSDVTVGHGAILHGCNIGDNSLIGMGAIILNGAKIGKNCLIGAGALVTQGMEIPDGMMALGSPAKIRRPLTQQEIAENTASALSYVEETKNHYAE